MLPCGVDGPDGGVPFRREPGIRLRPRTIGAARRDRRRQHVGPLEPARLAWRVTAADPLPPLYGIAPPAQFPVSRAVEARQTRLWAATLRTHHGDTPISWARSATLRSPGMAPPENEKSASECRPLPVSHTSRHRSASASEGCSAGRYGARARLCPAPSQAQHAGLHDQILAGPLAVELEPHQRTHFRTWTPRK
jgi:hypothetical protein